MSNIKKLQSLVNAAQTILVLQPDSPDGDSIGSALGLEEILGDLGKTVLMYSYKEPEPYLRARAEHASTEAAVPVQVVPGGAERLPFPDGTFDAGVASLVLCSVRDQDTALAELRRVVRPGGELRFYEHVRAWTPLLAAAQRAADRAWPLFNGGCHLTRDTEAAIGRAFTIERCRRFRFQPCCLAPLTSPVILGMARRP